MRRQLIWKQLWSVCRGECLAVKGNANHYEANAIGILCTENHKKAMKTLGRLSAWRWTARKMLPYNKI